ncbi:MAG TPA: hypothetical protein VE972_05300 [Conexibacter sp.]|nr:hypothetical protein [Conexibacter sp.]
MRILRKLIPIALAATLVLCLGAGTAAALRSLEARPGGAITANAAGLGFTEPGGLTITSDVTLTGRFERRIAKRVGAVFGQIEDCRANNGRGPAGSEITANIRCELPIRPERGRPWPVLYNSIRGTLPNITGVLITVERAQFLLSLIRSVVVRLNECLYRGDIGADSNTPLPLTSLTVQRERSTARLEVILEQVNQPCAENGRLSGTFTLTARQTLALL